jgi:dTDP-4-amino-4,6-dideoxygalactose transaminase
MCMDMLGYNYRMDEMSAALARSQLTRYDWSVQKRREIATHYDEAFAGKVRTVPHGSDSARHLYQLLVDNRDDMRAKLLPRGVGTQVHYSPTIPLQPYYRERFGYQPGMFPNAERYAAHTLSIPMFPTLTEQEVERVITSVLGVCG